MPSTLEHSPLQLKDQGSSVFKLHRDTYQRSVQNEYLYSSENQSNHSEDQVEYEDYEVVDSNREFESDSDTSYLEIGLPLKVI